MADHNNSDYTKTHNFKEDSQNFINTLNEASKHRRKPETNQSYVPSLLQKHQSLLGRSSTSSNETISAGIHDGQKSNYSGVLDLPSSNNIDLKNKPPQLLLPPVSEKDKKRMNDLSPRGGSAFGQYRPCSGHSSCQAPAEAVTFKTRCKTHSSRISLDSPLQSNTEPLKVFKSLKN